jgi:uncharacterized protein with NAD-binding domain and iron-sulfur cluster
MPDDEKDGGVKSKPLDRRLFLKGGAAAALTVSGPACSGDFDFDERAEFPEVPGNKLSLKPNGKSVLILGGGFGGMHAACELVDRGFKVTILEKSSMLGGKLKSWRDRTWGVPPMNDPDWKGYPRDHGAHAVWGFYNNLREFMGRHDLKLWRFPRNSTMYNFIDSDGTQSIMANAPRWPYPFSLLERARDLDKMTFLSDGDKKKFRKASLKMAAFDFENESERMYLDSVSFPQWARSVGMPEPVITRLFAPLSEMAMFDHLDHTSALYMLTVIHLVIGHHEDWNIDIFPHPPGETYVAPLEKYIKDRGGEIIYNTPVARINWEGDRIRSVTAGDLGVAGAPGAKTWKCNVCGSVFASPIKPSRCPICGAPSAQIIALSGKPPRDYTADFYIMALETKGAKEVLKASNLVHTPYFGNILQLDSTSVFVADMWFSGGNYFKKRFPGHLCFYTSNFKFIGITLDWSFDGTINGKKAVDPLFDEYQGKDTTVIETQIANTEMLENYTDEEIVRVALEELRMVIPDLPYPTDFYINRWDTYSPQRVGYEANRPTVKSPIDNFFIIGDWVRTDHMSVYMEKTNVAAKMAVNLIMDRIGQGKYQARVLPSGSPSLLVDLPRLFLSPRP